MIEKLTAGRHPGRARPDRGRPDAPGPHDRPGADRPRGDDLVERAAPGPESGPSRSTEPDGDAMTPHVDVPGGRLFVVDEGAGPPLVLLHAGVADLRAWDAHGRRPLPRPATASSATTPRLRRVDDRGRRVLAARRPASRLSTPSGSGGRPSSATRAAGCSRSMPRSSRPSGSSPSSASAPAWAASTADRPRTRSGRRGRVRAGRHGGAVRRRRADARSRRRIWVDGPLQPAGRVAAADPRPGLRDEPAAQRDRACRGASAIRLDPAGRDRLAELRCPVLAVAGEPRLLGRRRRRPDTSRPSAPDARAVVWPDVAHMIGMEQPDRLAETIVEFLAPIPRWG